MSTALISMLKLDELLSKKLVEKETAVFGQYVALALCEEHTPQFIKELAKRGWTMYGETFVSALTNFIVKAGLNLGYPQQADLWEDAFNAYYTEQELYTGEQQLAGGKRRRKVRTTR